MKKKLTFRKATMYQDGNNVVVEYEEDFVNGQFLTLKDGEDTWIIIFKKKTPYSNPIEYHVMLTCDGMINMHNSAADDGWNLSTDSEKQQLLDALHARGKDWDAEKLEIVNWKWKPKVKETYYYPTLIGEKMYFYENWCGDDFDNRCFSFNLVFRTKEEAIACTKEMLKYLQNKYENNKI